jgi:hypothetical protein
MSRLAVHCGSRIPAPTVNRDEHLGFLQHGSNPPSARQFGAWKYEVANQDQLCREWSWLTDVRGIPETTVCNHLG